MEKNVVPELPPKVRLNDAADMVARIRKGLERTGGGYCPCRIRRIPENICICKEFFQTNISSHLIGMAENSRN